MSRSHQFYHQKINRVIDYINNHLADDLCLEKLASIAHISRFHFQRQFSALTGISVSQLIKLKRMKRASYQLVFSKQMAITDIAFEAGFANLESFSRAFKKIHGQKPSQFRASPDWQAWSLRYHQSYYQSYDQSLPSHLKQSDKSDAYLIDLPEIVDISEVKIAVLEHHGPATSIYESVGRFINWRKKNKCAPHQSRTYNILYSNESTDADEYRRDICAEFSFAVEPNEQGVVGKIIAGGRYARLRFEGSWDQIDTKINYLYAVWLPASGELLRDLPTFVEYLNRLPEVQEFELMTDIYLPIH